MKSIGLWPLYLILLSLLVACGKENVSGQNGSSNFPIGNPYNVGPVPYSYQNVSLDTVLMQNPCVSGFAGMGGMGGMPQQYAGQRIPIQTPVVVPGTQIQPGDMYVGVTSYGDVAALVGQAVGQPSLFIAYLCPRSFTQQGTGQVIPQSIRVGAMTPTCHFKPLTAATVMLPGATAEFGWLEGGNSMRQPFGQPVCR